VTTLGYQPDRSHETLKGFRGGRTLSGFPRCGVLNSQGWSELTTLGYQPDRSHETLKGFRGGRTLSGFPRCGVINSQGSRFRSNPGLKLANAFGVMDGPYNYVPLLVKPVLRSRTFPCSLTLFFTLVRSLARSHVDSRTSGVRDLARYAPRQRLGRRTPESHSKPHG